MTPSNDPEHERSDRALLSEVVVALLLPGWRLRRRVPQAAIALLVAGVVPPVAALVYALASGRTWVALSLDERFLGWVMVAGIFAVLTRLAAVAQVVVEVVVEQAAARDLVARDLWVPVVVLAVIVPLTVGTIGLGRARADIGDAFSDPSDVPLFEADDEASPVAPAAATTTVPAAGGGAGGGAGGAVGGGPLAPATTTTYPHPSSGVASGLLDEVINVLLLGGDAGPDRQGLRTDSMMVFSLHPPSGRAALLSIPRDLVGLVFPPGTALAERYPDGFGEKANSVYPIVSADAELRAAYDTVDGVRPGVVATAQAIGYTLDMTIDDYVLIDMQGFLELVDALGGVTVNVPKAVPMPGNVPGARTEYPDYIGPGRIHMDGTTALGYVRSRKGDSDFQRSARQRDLLEALANQISWGDVVARFPSVASAIGGTLRTSLTPDELADVLATIGGRTAIVESVGLNPPLIDQDDPDVDLMARVSGAVRLALVTGEPSGY
ncbi:MAG TPA: LCP family protein [Ilumatobacter sp.]